MRTATFSISDYIGREETIAFCIDLRGEMIQNPFRDLVVDWRVVKRITGSMSSCLQCQQSNHWMRVGGATAGACSTRALTSAIISAQSHSQNDGHTDRRC
ncbi:hypothetical protein Tco_0969061 [Tanacetum coccineum]